MSPAEAMGTFLRAWRSEWVKLSRAQLALAVSAHLPKRKAITPRAILYWEEGHPPGSTEELESLCTVMGRHGLIPCEIEQFRQAVFAACLGRHYPELFASEDWTRRDDVEDFACRLHYQEAWGGSPLNRVQLVGLMTELQHTLRERDRGMPRSQRRSQQAALIYLMRSMSYSHVNGGRTHLSAPAFAREVEFLETHFDGRGPDPSLTAAKSKSFALGHSALAAGNPELLWEQFRMLREVKAGGPLWDDIFIFWSAAHNVVLFGTADQREYVRCQAPVYLRSTKDHYHVAFAPWVMCRLALRDGLVEEAEPYLEGFQRWQHEPVLLPWWAEVMGCFYLAAGDRDEASRYLELGLAAYQRLRHVRGEALMESLLRECE